MDTTKYSHPWEQDQALTDRLLKLVDDEDWDLFGIADVGPLNEKARPGRRPKDLWPTAKAVLMFAVGLADPFTRGWVQNGKSGKFYSYALLELDRRVWTVKRFLRQEGYLEKTQSTTDERSFTFCGSVERYKGCISESAYDEMAV